MKSLIDQKLDIFFDKNSKDYLNNEIFSQIYILLQEYEHSDREFYNMELKRIRDLQNSINYAREEGFREGIRIRIKSGIINVINKIIDKNYEIEDFIDYIYFSKPQIKEIIKEVKSNK